MPAIEDLLPSDFRQSITGPLRRFYTTVFLGCFGMGLTLSMYVVYLHNVRHFSTSFATIVLGGTALCGLATSPLWGSFVDRFGPVPVILVAGSLDALAVGFWAFIHTPTQAIAAAVALALFGGGGWGAGGTLLSRLVEPEMRTHAFGFNFMLVNLGIGFGGLVSAAIVNINSPRSFETLYLGNVLVIVVCALITIPLWSVGGPASADDEETTAQEGWSTVLRDRRLIELFFASLIMMVGGYGSMEAGFSLFVVNELHITVHAIGLIFFVNTSVIVLAQLFVIRRITSRSRTRVMALAAVLWASFWVVLDLCLGVTHYIAVIALCGAMVIFAVGETMVSPVASSLVNDIAPEHLRGRYNAVQGATWGLSNSIGPVVASLYFDHGLTRWWPLGTAAVALVGAAMLLHLRRRLTPVEDGRLATSVA